ncbi:MAG TPA: pyruvate kinase [Candidatus Merdenecus merdavium]|nr:pyruvate kinase [Candidatus Merdenecus merdavium]
MKRTKIICTMGPNTNDRELMKELAKNGMDVARFNFSHGDHEEQLGRIKLLRSVREELDLPIAMLLDTKGPEIRTGRLKDGKKVNLKQGQSFTLSTEERVGDETGCYISYAGLVDEVKKGNRILIDDGLIELEVEKVIGNQILCTVISGGDLGEKKGVNVPNVSVKLPSITEKDREDILFAIKQGFDFIAASFVRNAECIKEMKQLLRENNGEHISVIAKIENAEGINNLDEILHYSDGIMVARGDLGVEIPASEVPYIQKTIISKCNANYKPVITATQMLDSMMRNPRPTRAEVTDVANAIYDGTDAIMLSGETAMGKYPVEALKMMCEVAITTERHLNNAGYELNKKMHRKKNVSSAVGLASVSTARNLEAKCIVTPTVTGQTPRMISNFRPEVPIYATSPNDSTLRKMQIYWGVKPYKIAEEHTKEHIEAGVMRLIKEKGLVNSGDLVVFTAGDPATNIVTGEGAMTNTMRVVQA